MTNQEKRIIRNVIKRLRGERAAEKIKNELTGTCRLYLESWVIPALEIMIDDDRRRTEMKTAEYLAS